MPAKVAKAKTAKAKAAKPMAAKPTPKTARAKGAKPTPKTAKAKAAKPTPKTAKAKAAKPTPKTAKAKAAKPTPKGATPKTAELKAKATPRAKPPTAERAPQPPPPPPPISGIPSPPAARARLLVDGEAFGAATLSLRPLPALRLTSGALIACDPFDVQGPAFTRRLARGSYDVVAAVATYPGKHGPGEQVLAAVILQVSPAVPVAWEPATFAGEPAALDPAYHADSGVGCFMDVRLQAALASEPTTWPTVSYRALERQLLDLHHTPSWGWAIYPEPPTAAGCVAFLGGSSPPRRSYWGLDERGAVACLLTDLETFPADVWAGLSPLA